MDPIADMLSQITNAARVGKRSVKVPYSKHKMAIAEKMADAGYIESADHKGQQPHKVIELVLTYDENGRPAVRGIERVSKPSRRFFEKAKNLQSFKHGYGHTLISSPNGILTENEAREQHVGGEILFRVW